MQVEKVDIRMQAVGAYPEVLGNLYRKAQGEVMPDVTTALILVGGMQRGVIQAWQYAQLETIKLAGGIDYILGLSVGAAVGREAVGGTIQDNKNIFHKEDIDCGIILDTRKFPWVNFEAGISMLRRIGASEEAVKSSKTQLLIHLQDRQTGKADFFPASEMDDTAAAVISAMHIPGITKTPRLPVNGRLYRDAMHIDALPIRYAVEQLKATDILVMFTDNPFRASLGMTAVNLLVSHATNYNKREFFSILVHHWKQKGNLRMLTDQTEIHRGVRIAGTYPEVMPMALNERRASLIEEVGRQGAAFIDRIVPPLRTQGHALRG